jgi:hypothetical protein
MNQSPLSSLTLRVLTISRGDRWLAFQRLQELGISCQCLSDGQLEVEINRPVDLPQLRSVVQQLTATRTELVEWLNRCWKISLTAEPDR